MARIVRYDKSLIRSMESSLRKSFNQHLALTKKPTRTQKGQQGPFTIRMVNEEKSAYTDDGLVQRVLSIYSKGQLTDFYFGFVAAFGLAESENDILLQASLSVFYDIYGGELTPLFRAEWDYEAATDSKSTHAQPHWHFVQSPARIEGILRTVNPLADFSPKADGLFGRLVDYGKFHFAMHALWEAEEPSHMQVFEAKDFENWFRGLADYVAEQIAYLLSKPHTGIMEFGSGDGAT